MSTLRLATASNVRAFQILIDALGASDGKWSQWIDGETLDDEVGRFRVWAGNLGALQKGHSSLDYRLRGSPVLFSSALRLLNELDHNLNETCAVVSGSRLPYEDQKPTERAEDDGDDNSSSEEEEEESDSDEPRSELRMRYEEIVDIIDQLYKLSVRIRTPTVRSRSLKASSYMSTDPETGVDLLAIYADQDRKHVQELLSQLRKPHSAPNEEERDFLTERLSLSITLRRRHFKYWKRHRDKLGASAVSEETPDPRKPTSNGAPNPTLNDTTEARPAPMISSPKPTPSQKTGKTLLSGTEATHHHQSLDDIVDTKSVTSYAVTVKDLEGKGVDLPPPPKAATNDRDFECPYCWIVCPARYGKGRAWKTHLLQDLQPYSCTYRECDNPEQLFRSRREWAEHEATHRKLWRCPEHVTTLYSSHSGLENHLRQEHIGSFPDDQIAIVAKIGETTAVDLRTQCPICFASADTEGLGDLQNHIANHLERFATFALPHGREDDEDGSSSIASLGSSHSQSLPESVRTDTSNEMVALEDNLESEQSIEFLDAANSGQGLLSAESLQQLPDESQNRLARISNQVDDRDNSEEDNVFDYQSTLNAQTIEEAEILSSGFESHDDEDQEPSKQAIISPAEVPTLRSLYQSRQLLQRDQSFAPDDTYNQMISFCHHDLTRLRVDAIVNNAPTNFRARPMPSSLHHAIFKAGGSGLRREARSKVGVKVGQAELTRGYDLPSSWVIHAVAPTYAVSKGVGQFDVLSECYRSALRIAAHHALKTIAFPCLGAGGCGFPPNIAARTALQTVREYLDADPKHRPERIIFCARTAVDAKAYTDFLPVFFPPTHGDLDRERTSNRSANRTVLAAEVLEARTQLQKALIEVSVNYNFGTQSTICAHDMRRIDSTLTSIRDFLLGSKELKRNPDDLTLLCSVVLTAGADILVMAKRARELGLTREAQFVWTETNTAMLRSHGLDLTSAFDYCWIFANILDDILTRGIAEPDAMAGVRQILTNYSVKRRGQDPEGVRYRLGKVLDAYESKRLALENRGLVQFHQMPSVARLYLLGHLEAKPTMARPSVRSNHTVCLLREDITRLEVDIVVNSTDPNFSGMGALDRSIFKKGGEELCEAVKQFGKCEPGDIKMTLGYSLPAKHILHVVPPGQFRKDTKNVLRNIYRKILHTAVLMKATSIAIPCIGIGIGNYRRRDYASLAMEEVKRFLESGESVNGPQKIVFVVFSSDDEFIYRSLLPIYFPPPNGNTSSTVSVKQPAEAEGISSSPFPVPANRPSLSISVDEAPRSVRSGKQPATLRPLSSDEYQAFMRFESHVIECNICSDSLLERTRKLCEQGYPLAQTILQRMEMSDDANIYTKADEPSQREKLEAPVDLFSGSMLLLSIVAEGTHNSPEGPYIEVGKPNRTNDDELVLKNSSVSKDSNNIAQATEEPAVVLGAQAGASKVTPGGNSYPQSNQRLRNIKDDRDYKHRNEEEIDAPSITKVPSDIAASPGGESNDSKPASGRATFNRRILAHLDHDLKNRPGSYIGRHVKDIAFAFELHPRFISHALQQLALEGKVHNTVDSDMWVISKPSTELPAIKQQDRLGEPSVTDTDALADQILLRIHRAGHGLSILDLTSELQTPTATVLPAIRQLAAKWYVASWHNDEMWGLTSVGSARAVEMQKELAETEKQVARSVNPDQDPSRDLSQRALSYLRSLPGLSENISHLATTFDTPIAELQPVLEQLGSDGLIETKGDESSWTAILPPNEGPSDGRSSLSGGSDETGPHPSLGSIHDSHEIPTASTPSPVLTEPADAIPEETTHADDTPGTPNQTSTATDGPHLNAPASEQEHHSETSPQEHSAPKSPITSRASSWRDGRGANMRQRTKSNRALREDIEEDVESGTASSLRYARMAKERKHNKSSRARTDDIDDELEYYDGQEEDYVDDEVAPT